MPEAKPEYCALYWTELDPRYCTICLVKTGEFTPIVKWNGMAICREHLAINHLKYEGLRDLGIVPTVLAPAMLQ